jgi:translocation and assembly module TamA
MIRRAAKALLRKALRGLAGLVMSVMAVSALSGALSGCASIRSWIDADEPTQDAPAEPTGRPAYDVAVEAPDDLASLLNQYLDVVRLRTLPEGRDLDRTEWARLVGAAPAQARELLETEGYFDAEVKAAREAPTTEGSLGLVRITVQPGPRTQVGRVRLELQGDFEQAAEAGDADASTLRRSIDERWPLKAGAPFRDAEWSRSKNALLAELRAAGYASATLSGSSAQVFAQRRQADLLVVADSGPLFLAGELLITGLEHQDEATVKNLAGFDRGERLTEAALLDYQERLGNSGLFDSAVVTAETDPQRAANATVNVQLKEAPLQQATTSIGFSANTGPRAGLEYLHRRPFDFALTARSNIEWGRDLKSFSGELSTHPEANFYRRLLGIEAERLLSDTDIVKSTRLRAGRNQTTTRIERFYFVEFEDSQRDVTVASTERALNVQALSANAQFVFRKLDSVLLPTRGYTLSLQAGAGQARSPVTGEGPFTRLYGRATGYLPVGRNWFGQARVELGQVFVTPGLDTPDSQRFRAGGDESVRGYSYRSLAPTTGIVVDSGKVLFTGSVELARPIVASLPSVWGAVFIDVGRAADSWSGLDPAWGYGVGARWRSPVGPLKLDLAYGQEVRSWRLHFSLGIAF